MSGRKCAECGEVHLAGENGAIYCCGSLLQAVQMSGMFSDSKYFVDMVTKHSLERTMADWQLFCTSKRNESSLKHLTNFVEYHFDKPNSETISYCPSDWQENPDFLSMVKNQELKHFAILLNALWKALGRQMKDAVRTNPSNYSLVYVPNLSIVPGGRFQEFYYWDTYFIVRGLLHSGMVQTARGMLDNLLYLVHEYKFVPNGGRVYYWGRSQPPLLVAMVKAYVEATKDKKYAKDVVGLLDTEMEYFMRTHSVEVKGRIMYQYRDKSSGPRPEAYREDVNTAEALETEEEKEFLYSNLKAACESGQNFSSRWFVTNDKSNRGSLIDTKTSWIVPVDLNCIIFRNCKTIAEFYTSVGNTARAEYYREVAANLIKAITAVLWNEARGIWLDYDLKNNAPRDFFAVTNFAPLWARAYPIHSTDKISDSLMAYIAEHQLESFPGGVPQTLYNSGEQWDYPNVWPSSMYMLTEGLNNLGTMDAQAMSQRLRAKFVYSAYRAYKANGTLFDKYNCEESGTPGIGGEHASQAGYALTNGVLIELLARYGQQSDEAYKDEEVPITSLAYLERATADLPQAYCSTVCSQETSSEPDCMRQLPQIQVLPMCSQPNDDDNPFSDPTSLCSICNPKKDKCPCEAPAPDDDDDDDCDCGPPRPVQAPKIPSPKGKSGGCPPKPVTCCPPPPGPCPPPKKACGPPCPPAKAPCPPQPKPPSCCPPKPEPPASCPPKKACPPQPCPPPAKPPCPPKAEVKEFCSICNCAIPPQVEKICSACNQAQEEQPAPCPPQPCPPKPCPPKPCPPKSCPPLASLKDGDDKNDDDDSNDDDSNDDDDSKEDDDDEKSPSGERDEKSPSGELDKWTGWPPQGRVMPKGPTPVPWKPAKLDSDECDCAAENNPESCSQEEQDDEEDQCCCDAEPEKPKRKSGNSNSNDCDKDKDEDPCCCDQGDDDQNGAGGEEEEGCCVVDEICSVESQKAPQNKIFPLEDDNGKGCPCTPPSPPKSSGKGCK